MHCKWKLSKKREKQWYIVCCLFFHFPNSLVLVLFMLALATAFGGEILTDGISHEDVLSFCTALSAMKVKVFCPDAIPTEWDKRVLVCIATCVVILSCVNNSNPRLDGEFLLSASQTSRRPVD